MSEVPKYQPEEAANFQAELDRQSEANMQAEIGPTFPEKTEWPAEMVENSLASAQKSLEQAQENIRNADDALTNEGLEPTRRQHFEHLKATAQDQERFWADKIEEINERRAA